MRLYNYWRSSASWRVRIALAWKGIPYEYRPVNILPSAREQERDEYRALNALAQVPVLEIEDGGGTGAPHRIAQSVAIIEYLEERFPAPPLLPRDLQLRARARQLAEMVNSGIQPLQNSPVLGFVKETLHADEKAWARHFIARGLSAVERTAAQTAGKFLVGDELSVADVFLVPQLYGAPLRGRRSPNRFALWCA